MAGGTWKPKTNRHACYYLQKTATNPLGTVITNYIKRRPVVITGLATDTNPRLRVRHYTVPSTETYGSAGVGIVRRFTGSRAGKYVPQ
jgi:hypothetical protein